MNKLVMIAPDPGQTIERYLRGVSETLNNIDPTTNSRVQGTVFALTGLSEEHYPAFVELLPPTAHGAWASIGENEDEAIIYGLITFEPGLLMDAADGLAEQHGFVSATKDVTPIVRGKPAGTIH